MADAVGRTPPSIYLHFDTKDELIQAVCARQFDALTAAFAAAVDGLDDDPVERIRRMAGAYVRFALDHPEQYRILFMSGAGKNASSVETLDDLRLTDCFGMLAAAVTQAVDDGSFRPADPLLTSLGLWAAVHGMSSLLVAHDLDLPPVEVFLEQVLEQNLRGLLAR